VAAVEFRRLSYCLILCFNSVFSCRRFESIVRRSLQKRGRDRETEVKRKRETRETERERQGIEREETFLLECVEHFEHLLIYFLTF
jgi:hypothetical protein